MKETSAHNRLWKMRCKEFVELKMPFKVFNVSRPDDIEFCKTLTKRHNLLLRRDGAIVIFSPQI